MAKYSLLFTLLFASAVAFSGCSSSGSSEIAVSAPTEGASISAPFVVEGTTTASAETLEASNGTIWARLLDSKGELMVESNVKVAEDGSFNFNGIYFLSGQEGTEGTLEVFFKDADGNAVSTASSTVAIQ